MQPLIRDNSTCSTLNNKRKYWNGKSLCIISSIIFIVIIIAIAYFGSSSSNLNNNNPARDFYEKPDNTGAYPSTIVWKDPGLRKPPPGSKLAPKQPPIDGDNNNNPAIPTDGNTDTGSWKVAPPGTDGTTVNGITYGGDDVTGIVPPDDFVPITDGEVPYKEEQEEQQQEEQEEETEEEQQEEKEKENEKEKEKEKEVVVSTPSDSEQQKSSSTSSTKTEDKNAVNIEYPTKVTTVDRDRIIIDSNPDSASNYYKSNGADDLISSMPYLVEDTCSKSFTNCEFKQYSGYLLANNNAEIHYWFIEAEQTPQTKPIFIWTNGGPGCSGLDGLLTEHGPWRVTDNLKVHYNPYSWNTEVNMVYLEQPYGVGFSAIENDDNVVSGDQNAADDMDAAIRNFLNKFPFYKNNKIYLSSESWGGHYVPITSYTILQNNDHGATPQINFGGFFLGNPYTDFYENAYGFVGDIFGHGLMKSKDWDTWRNECWGNEDAIDSDPVCSAIYSRAYISAYNANVYALDYPQCIDDEDWSMDLINRPAPSFWVKDGHIHHAAKGFMEKVLAHHDYNALKMSLEKSELQQLHDRIAQRLALEEDDYYSPNYPPPQQVDDGQQQQSSVGNYPPPQQGNYPPPAQQSGNDQSQQQQQPQQPQQGMPPQQGGDQGQQQMPQQPVQGMPQQPVAGYPGQSQQSSQQNSGSTQTGTGTVQQKKVKPKAPNGVEHNRPNHNIGNKAVGGSQAERDEAEAEREEEEAAEKQKEEELKDDDSTGTASDDTDGYLPCIEYDMADYLNLQTVQSALNVKPTEWQMCSDTVWNAWPESDYDTKVEAFYSEIIENYLVSNNLKLAIYSGDDDSVCGLQGTEYWLDRWKYKVNDNIDFESWEDDNSQLGGFYSQYMTMDNNYVALHFLTVRTAGHMVPTTQPSRALTILKKYLYSFDKQQQDGQHNI